MNTPRTCPAQSPAPPGRRSRCRHRAPGTTGTARHATPHQAAAAATTHWQCEVGGNNTPLAFGGRYVSARVAACCPSRMGEEQKETTAAASTQCAPRPSHCRAAASRWRRPPGRQRPAAAAAAARAAAATAAAGWARARAPARSRRAAARPCCRPGSPGLRVHERHEATSPLHQDGREVAMLPEEAQGVWRGEERVSASLDTCWQRLTSRPEDGGPAEGGRHGQHKGDLGAHQSRPGPPCTRTSTQWRREKAPSF